MKKNNSPEKYEFDCEDLFKYMLNGIAVHKIVLDKKGKPADYIFLRMNKTFEEYTGLKSANILNKRVTVVIPDIKKDPIDWIDKYGQVALTGKSIKFEQYSESLKRWYAISAYSPKKNYFVTIFNDITDRKRYEKEIVAGINEQEKSSEKLRDQLEQITKLNKLMIGRELKMIELKKEIRKLKGISSDKKFKDLSVKKEA